MTSPKAYVPPAMRHSMNAHQDKLNNNESSSISTFKDRQFKAFKPEYNLPTILHNVTSSKAYIPPAIRLSMNAHQGKKNNNEFSSISTYKDRQFKGSRAEYEKKLNESTTIYVGSLNLFTTKEDILNLFSSAGKIKQIIMGLDNDTSGSGGFCFIEYETRLGAETCMKTMDKVVLDGKKLKIDWDAGFIEGRQYTRVKAKKRFSFSSIYPSFKKDTF